MIRARLLLLSTISIVLSGCATGKIVLHPIENTDIMRIPKGTTIGGDITRVSKDGYYISDYYMNEVMQAKVEAVKKAT